MDNQPTPASNTPQQPVSQPPTPPLGTQPSMPIQATSGNQAVPVPPVKPTISPQPITPVPSPQQDTPKKKSKGLLIGIICVIALLLIGGAVATFIIIKTQPSNIIASSLNNLFNAKHIAIDGNIEMASKGSAEGNSIKINFTTSSSETNNSTTAQAEISLPMLGLPKPITLELNEVLISDGKMYAKVKGIREVLSRNNIATIGGAYINNETITLIENVGEILEDRWIMISLEEIINSNLYRIDEQTKQKILSTSDCTKNVINTIPSYSNEISDIYKKHPFVIMQQQPDSFYSISFNPEQLTNFGNSIPQTKLYQDLASCLSESVKVASSTTFTPESAKTFVEAMPNISAKFDGFMDYHLSELKIAEDSNYSAMSADLKFNYNSTSSISAPSEYVSIIDIINEIMSLYQPTIYPSSNCPSGTNCVDATTDTVVENYNL